MYIQNRKQIVVLVCVIVVAAMSTACTLGQAQAVPTATTTLAETVTDDRVVAEGTLMPARYSVLGFATGGELRDIRVTEGQRVLKGEMLARLGDPESLEASLSQAKLEQLSAQQTLDDLDENADLLRIQSALALNKAENALRDAQAALERLETSSYQDELEKRNDAIDDAEEALHDARETLDENADLDPEDQKRKDAQTAFNAAEMALVEAVYARDSWQAQPEQARAALALAQKQVEDAQRTADIYADGPDPDDVSLAQARLDAATVQAAAVQSALDNMVLTAPYDATVVDITEMGPGEVVAPGTMVVMLADFAGWLADTRDLTELEVVDVQVGQKATVTPDALPDLELAGVVESIDRVFSEQLGEILYTVHIRLDEGNQLLRWGMTVTVVFE